MSERELKPCPFCGSEVNGDFGLDDAKERWFVECTRCGGCYESSTSLNRCIVGWNNRPTSGRDAFTLFEQWKHTRHGRRMLENYESSFAYAIFKAGANWDPPTQPVTAATRSDASEPKCNE